MKKQSSAFVSQETKLFFQAYNPARKPEEAFEDYKKRQKSQSYFLKRLKKRRFAPKIQKDGIVERLVWVPIW